MRYTVTLTEFSGYSYPRDPDAAAVGVTTQVGEPFEVLAAVVDPRNDWRNIHPRSAGTSTARR